MKTYPATEAEAEGLRKGTITLLVIPFKRQPPQDWCPIGCGPYHPTRVDRNGEEYPGPEQFGAYNEDWDIKAPYAPGDEIGVREAWSPRHRNRKRPIIACVLCESVAARKVQSIIASASEIMATGIIYDADAPIIGPCEADAGDLIEQFSAEWNRRHPDLPWTGNPWAFLVTVEKK